MKLLWTRPASIDRRAIRSYIASNNTSAALRFDESLSASARRLVDQPELGRPGRVSGTRELVIHRHYVLIYRIVDDLVLLLRVLHTGRQWPPGP